MQLSALTYSNKHKLGFMHFDKHYNCIFVIFQNQLQVKRVILNRYTSNNWRNCSIQSAILNGTLLFINALNDHYPNSELTMFWGLTNFTNIFALDTLGFSYLYTNIFALNTLDFSNLYHCNARSSIVDTVTPKFQE